MRKSRKRLKENFAIIFNSLSDDEKTEMASSLMLESHLRSPYSINKLLMEIEFARMAKRVEELNEANEASRKIVQELKLDAQALQQKTGQG